jgi:hypothetical protein
VPSWLTIHFIYFVAKTNELSMSIVIVVVVIKFL